MPIHPSFIAYANRPGRNPRRLPIGVAWPRSVGGFTVLLQALPLHFNGRIELLEPRTGFTSKARFLPAAMPPRLRRPGFGGERRVWNALQQAPLPPGTRVFYNRAPRGCRRRPDFLILWPARGVIAIEVKGGRLSYCGGFRQPLAGTSWSKRIEPWLQSHRALAQILAALRRNPLAIPHVSVVAMPGTSAADLPFPSAPHMLTSEELAPQHFARKLEALLPSLDAVGGAALRPALDAIADALTRGTGPYRP